MYELQTVETRSNYFETLDQSVADYMPFLGKSNIMDLTNWSPRSDCVISVFGNTASQTSQTKWLMSDKGNTKNK